MNIYNVIILDESGSMSSIRKQTILSMNEVLNGIRMNQAEFPDQKHFVTIVTFEGDGFSGVKTRRDRVPVAEIKDFTEEDYRPGACTPLYDAMGKTLSAMDAMVKEGEAVVATIITDGYENSSSEYSGKIIKNMVTRLRDKGWTISYIGANQDAVEVARDLNITNALNFDATDEGMSETARRFRRANRRASLYLSMYDCAPQGGLSDFFVEDEIPEEKKN